MPNENKIYELLDSDFSTLTYRVKTDLGTFSIPQGDFF